MTSTIGPLHAVIWPHQFHPLSYRPETIIGPVRREGIIASIVHVHLHRQSHLTKIASADCRLGARLAACERRQEHPRQDSDNRNHNQQLDKREALAPLATSLSSADG